MDYLFHAFIGTFIVTFSFVMLSLTSVGKENSNYSYQSETQTETVFQDEEIEEVTYEEVDENVSIESLKQRENQVNVKYTKVS